MPKKLRVVGRGPCKLSNAKLEGTLQEIIGAGSIGEILSRMCYVFEVAGRLLGTSLLSAARGCQDHSLLVVMYSWLL